MYSDQGYIDRTLLALGMRLALGISVKDWTPRSAKSPIEARLHNGQWKLKRQRYVGRCVISSLVPDFATEIAHSVRVTGIYARLGSCVEMQADLYSRQSLVFSSEPTRRSLDSGRGRTLLL